jgi:hypothetical protein
MRHALTLLLLLHLVACREPATTVTISVPDHEGRETPIGGQQVVLLPYDRDSVIAALTAQAATPQPDPAPLERLLDSLRIAYAAYGATPAAGRPAAQQRLEVRRAELEPRVAELRAIQHAWRDATYATYDSVTFRMTRKLVRDPVSDTTDARGVVTIQPSRSGPWWVTVTAWDAADPFSEWYWNQPLLGDTVRLTTANARHRPRI